MKTLTITYFVRERDELGTITGETCMNLTVTDLFAEDLLSEGKNSFLFDEIERILKGAEILKGRMYVKGSVHDIRLSE